jgi:hypothetical protein
MRPELNQIQPDFASLAFADLRLRKPKPLCEFDLRYSAPKPCVAQDAEEDIVLTGGD